MRTAEKSGDVVCVHDLRYHATRYGVETILAMDDEPEALALATSIWQAEGHPTQGTGDSREALRIARSRLEPIEHFGIRLTPGELFVIKPWAARHTSPGASRGEAPSAVTIPRE